MSHFQPYFPGTGVYSGEVDCKKVDARGKVATGHGLWTSDNDTSVTIRGTWKENNPVDVEIVSAQGVTTKYNAERYKRLHPESRMSLMSDYGISDDAARHMIRMSETSRSSTGTRPSFGGDRIFRRKRGKRTNKRKSKRKGKKSKKRTRKIR